MAGTVLVIEDDPSVLQMLHDVLALNDMRVVGVSAREDAVRAAESTAPDVIVVDLMLRDTSGIELAAELRDAGFADTPMVALSGSPFMRELADEHGLFQNVLSKPIEPDDLVACVDEYMPD